MKKSTILNLNKINARFYKLTAEEFTQTRSFYWQGWKKLVPNLKKLSKKHSELKVLDLGCGNGRFAEFLYKQKIHPKIIYHGADNSQELLDFAEKKLEKTPIEKQLFNLDLIEKLLDNTLTQALPFKKYHLITLFGVLHHIPSKELRKKIFEIMQNHLVADGLFVFTAWRFLNEKRFDKKQIHPKIIEIDPGELEKNDYILDWQRGITAYRYCHFTDDQEMKNLIEGTNLKLIAEYAADGKSGNLNAYHVLQRGKQ